MYIALRKFNSRHPCYFAGKRKKIFSHINGSKPVPTNYTVLKANILYFPKEKVRVCPLLFIISMQKINLLSYRSALLIPRKPLDWTI